MEQETPREEPLERVHFARRAQLRVADEGNEAAGDANGGDHELHDGRPEQILFPEVVRQVEGSIAVEKAERAEEPNQEETRRRQQQKSPESKDAANFRFVRLIEDVDATDCVEGLSSKDVRALVEGNRRLSRGMDSARRAADIRRCGGSARKRRSACLVFFAALLVSARETRERAALHGGMSQREKQRGGRKTRQRENEARDGKTHGKGQSGGNGGWERASSGLRLRN